MSPKLKPLILPQLVQERRKLALEHDQTYVYMADNASSSDIASPVTPTFSRRGSHARYSSSSSSLELSLTCADSPASPTQLAHAHAASNTHSQAIAPSHSHAHAPSHASISSLGSSTSASSTVPPPSPANTTKTTKRSLPDVQEEPLEREDEEITILPEVLDDLYCLCNEPCVHRRPPLVHSATFPLNVEADYDAGFFSDSDFDFDHSTSKKRRGDGSSFGSGVESPFSGFTARISSKLPSLSRWKSSERRAANLAFTPASDPALDYYHRPSLSIAPSSRSSSVSGRGRRTLDRSFEPPLPPTPALSLYDSSDSVSLPAPLDIEAANEAGHRLERERALATTPLLPPLMTTLPPSQAPSAPQSPLEFPKIESMLPGSAVDLSSPQFFPSPALSSKPSISSFRHAPGSVCLSPPAVTSSGELPSPMLNLGLHDPWSDRLGHANFTISPKPYVPDDADLEVLQALRADWDQARINFTKHLVRTGEHYGVTSKTYALTEAKWAETEQEWRAAHDSVVDRFAALCNGNGDPSAALRWRQEDVVSPSAVPRFLDEGKFPVLGDEDIVGPMVRDAVMTPPRDISPPRGTSASRFFRNLADKVGLRK